MMTNDQLLLAAVENTTLAYEGLATIAEAGRARSVPAAMFSTTLTHLRNATSAITELELRARKATPVNQG